MGWEWIHHVDKIKNELMVELFFQDVLTNTSCLPTPTLLGSTKMSKEVQKGPEAPKPIFSEGGG